MNLYRINLDCGRMGNIYGIFVATPDEVKALQDQTIYFGEVLGKHSEIDWSFEDGEVELVSDDPAFIAKCEELKLVPFGIDPVARMKEQIEEDEYESEDDDESDDD